jgi:Putative Ig domain
VSIIQSKTAFVGTGSASIGLSQMFSVTAGSSNPTYLVLSALDRNEYTAGASGATGSLSGNGHTLGLSGTYGDARSAGIVFTYQGFTGRYYSSIYGYLDQLTYQSSGSLADVTNLSLFGASDLGPATSYAASAYGMIQVDASGYLGSATIITQPKVTAGVPAQATPHSIAAVANSFVGQAWNMNGCWVLASTIAAEAGASLPVQSTLIGLPGRANGEWIVAFNGPAAQPGNWQSMVTAGEIVVIGTPGGGGHITTCVSGSGSTAMLVDNITYEDWSGRIANLAHDGSSSDIIVAAPHAASQEWAGVQGGSVVIYELDTPIVSASVSSDILACLASQSLASLFIARDPASRAITSWQIYDTAAGDRLVLSGGTYSDHTAASALTTASLASVSLLAGPIAGTDTVEVRAFNGSFWGDWQSLAVSIIAPPVLAAQTPNQTWTGGKAVSLPLPTTTFKDPQGQTLRYSAHLSNGQALPGWLSFNAATDTFSGTAPITAQTLGIVVTATDTSGLSVSDIFSATVLGAPMVTKPTSNQAWTEGKAISLALPMNTFTDPQGQKLIYTASLSNGHALPTWLDFNAATATFGGIAPNAAQSLSIKVTATDSSGLATSESFGASVQAPVIQPGIKVSAPTPHQTWVGGQKVDLVLPANTFTDALGLKMTFAMYQESGPNVTSWLHFNPATDELLGTVPLVASGPVTLAVLAADSLHMTAVDLFGVTFVPSAGHTASTAAAGSFGMAQLFDPSHVATLLAFHS